MIFSKTFWIIKKNIFTTLKMYLKVHLFLFPKNICIHMIFPPTLLWSSLRFLWRCGHCPTCFSASLQVELKHILTTNVCSWKEVTTLFRNEVLSDSRLLLREQPLQTFSSQHSCEMDYSVHTMNLFSYMYKAPAEVSVLQMLQRIYLIE